MNASQTGLIIGPSTGWLYARKIFSLFEQESILKTTNANCVEVCLETWDSNDKRILSLKTGETFDAQTFRYLSLHLPDNDGQEPECQAAMAQELVTHCKANIALIHPLKVKGEYPLELYERMISVGVPLAVENMDSD